MKNFYTFYKASTTVQLMKFDGGKKILFEKVKMLKTNVFFFTYNVFDILLHHDSQPFNTESQVFNNSEKESFVV